MSDPEFFSTLGARIRGLRARDGQRLDDIAGPLDFSRSKASRLESDPGTNSLRDVIDYLNVMGWGVTFKLREGGANRVIVVTDSPNEEAMVDEAERLIREADPIARSQMLLSMQAVGDLYRSGR